jgi:hypothetical protein
MRADSTHVEDAIDCIGFDRLARHAEDDAAFFILGYS